MRLPSSDEIQYFQVVAKEQNISRAAEIIGIQQSSLSAAMRRLEQSVGTSLLIRNKTGVTLNKSGWLLLRKSQSLLDQWSDLATEISKANEPGRGRFTLGCHPTVGIHLLPRFVSSVLAESRHLEIRVRTDYSRVLTEKVIDHKLDFGVVVEPIRHPDLKITKLRTTDVLLWRAKRLSSQNATTLVYDPDMKELRRVMRQLDRTSLEFDRHLPVPNLELVAAMVRSGAGIGVLPNIMQDAFDERYVAPVNEKQVSIRTAIYLIRRSDSINSPAAKYLEKRLMKTLASR